ncbi:hypothetical protein F5Y00DRAFT_223102 [Daldinia vernicosa]|uniref:uncharacterized protein n=1 Tax=Daldinia vernicosa TaxID=114800 RepID=UPI00200722C8|nr:uncharacterized protein F5Y00DRAFT_223102 [Daldinia vernicosa]KAI0854433.1 hypothetical protein F5Y00DRAFT_223102 [Daldinia vernicosa]
MALTIKNLNSDASFLLSFEPIIPEFAQHIVTPKPFTLLLDPWITGPSKIFHSKISITTHIHPACISSLSELPSPPDLVIITQHKSDHCNEATLRQLPASGTNTIILAEPAAARLIKSWKYFDQKKIRTIERWEDPRLTGKQSVVRIPVPPVTPGGQGGEVTVAFIPQKRDLAGLHGAIGITYRPPPTHHLQLGIPTISKPPSPPATPNTPTMQDSDMLLANNSSTPNPFLLPPSPPVSPHSLRSVQSASTLLPSPAHSRLSTSFPRSVSQSHIRPATSIGMIRPISVLFSPHGISYDYIAPYVTSHLVAEAALPLTALLHCMDSVTNPWWLGGNISAGVPTGAEIATRLGARIWLSAHDGEKDVRGLATAMLKTKRWRREEVEGALDTREEGKPGKEKPGHARKGSSSSIGGVTTEIMRLGSGDEIVVSGSGMLWCSPENTDDQWAIRDAKARQNVKVKSQYSLRPMHARGEKISNGLKTKKSLRGGFSRFRSVVTPI